MHREGIAQGTVPCVRLRNIKNTQNRPLCYYLVLFLSVGLVVVLSYLPLENLFITFDTPEKAFEYYNWGESDIELVVEGENCGFVVGSKENTDTYLIIPKTTDGWKIGIGSDTKKIVHKLDDGISVYVYQYKNTNDYFITILNTSGGESKVSDDYNTEFYSLEKYNGSLDKHFITYYAHISGFDSQYSVVVNGKTIALDY